ncbi:hypothetical protein [Roseateles depolymerans]|uniref:Uncharacterized protein n=1 Tax=Roseateles depolymerans TaxID=76731 RepID=A0A0U3CTW6_9BURK|nr:hypothetical protein [Roseateles depolymerans]ALV04742.1 hypothetical protein RD2015_238 [Roseateles depolymerans]REG15247.1 hypothetical protein DES44_3754 [Roseateles depolymerans]
MMSFNRQSACVLAAVAALLAGCGGGSSDNASDTNPNTGVKPTNPTPPTTPTLSANQAAFEEFVLSPGGGSYLMHWSVSFSSPSKGRILNLFADSTTLNASPLTNGPQTSVESDPVNLTKTLSLPTQSPTRVLKDGVILVVPAKGLVNRITYVGNDVRVDALAEDKTTVAYSALRSNYETVALTGPLTSAPQDFLRFHDSLLKNPNVTATGATFLPGAKYTKFTKTNLGDRYNAFDCNAATTTASISPCASKTSLTAALTTGLISNSDGKTYRLADGTVSTVGGVQVWVATAPRPKAAILASYDEYRIYFELGGNVYTGSLIKDGAVMGSSFYVPNPNSTATSVVDFITPLPYDLRMNKAALDSIAGALTI